MVEYHSPGLGNVVAELADDVLATTLVEYYQPRPRETWKHGRRLANASPLESTTHLDLATWSQSLQTYLQTSPVEYHQPRPRESRTDLDLETWPSACKRLPPGEYHPPGPGDVVAELADVLATTLVKYHQPRPIEVVQELAEHHPGRALQKLAERLDHGRVPPACKRLPPLEGTTHLDLATWSQSLQTYLQRP
ncbi:unnamed protein product, partial [Iphiclides podalirius]